MTDNLEPPSPDRQVVARFWAMNAVRLVGLAITLFGIAAISGLFDVPHWLAVVIIVAGLGVYFAMPLVLARRWKSEK